MITKRYKIADVSFEMTSYYELIHKQSEIFITEEAPAFSLLSTKEKIEYERKMFYKEYNENIIISDEELEYTSFLRMLTSNLIDYNILLFHGSLVSVDNIGYLFTAVSGTGKSTHAKNYLKFFKERAEIINDDKPFLKICDNVVVAFGSPWNGKEGSPNNKSVELKSICLLNRGKENHIEKVKTKDFFHILLQQVYRPVEKEAMEKTLSLLDKLSSHVSFYILYCNMDVQSAKISFEGMNNCET